VFPDEEVRHFVHKAVGYSLTGDTREQCFFFPYGIGRNGKSVFVRTLERHVFGGLTVRAGRGITACPPNGKYPETEIAELAGARMILTSETEQGQKLNENLIKELTGGESMRGRHLFENAFTFLPVGKLWIVGNHKPVIKGTDDGVWRRPRLIHFTQKFEGASADRTLPDKLAAEASGILNWCSPWLSALATRRSGNARRHASGGQRLQTRRRQTRGLYRRRNIREPVRGNSEPRFV